MNSLPTIDHEAQWDLLKKALIASNVNLKIVEEIFVALLKISDGGGYGKIYISVLGGLIQEIKVEQTTRLEQFILKTEVKT
jgi:hypothetical protein